MKECPKCGKTYTDGTLNFCLVDGTPLSAADVSEPTVVMDRPGPPRKSRGLLFAAIGVLVILAGAGAVAALLIVTSYRQQDLKASGTATQPSTAASTPKPKTSPTAATAAETSPTPAPPPTSDDTDSSDEITPIDWDTTASGFKGEPGHTYKFECPPSGKPQTVYGSDIYTDYSSICTAAVHAGVITLAEGGIITLEYRPGRDIYGTTTRHDIKTNPTGEYRRSFVVRR